MVAVAIIEGTAVGKATDSEVNPEVLKAKTAGPLLANPRLSHLSRLRSYFIRPVHHRAPALSDVQGISFDGERHRSTVRSTYARHWVSSSGQSRPKTGCRCGARFVSPAACTAPNNSGSFFRSESVSSSNPVNVAACQ